VPSPLEYLAVGLGASVDHVTTGSETYDTVIGSWPPMDDIGPNPVAAYTIIFDLTGLTSPPDFSGLNPRLVLEIGGDDHVFDTLGQSTYELTYNPDDPDDGIYRSGKAHWTQENHTLFASRFMDGGSVHYVHDLPGGVHVEAAVAFAIIRDLEGIPNVWLPLVVPIEFGSATGTGGNPQGFFRSGTSPNWMNTLHLGYNTNGESSPAPNIDWGDYNELVTYVDGFRRATVGIWRPGDPFSSTFTPNVTPNDFPRHIMQIFSRGVLNLGAAAKARSRGQIIG